mgnify:CR=1 FL=1
MNFQNYSINKLEFPILLNRLVDYAILPATKDLLSNLVSSSNIEEIEQELTKVEEAAHIIIRSMRAPLYISSDYDKILLLLKKGAILDALSLYETVKLYETIKSNIKFASELLKMQITSPYYQSIVSTMYVNESIEKILVKSIDENGYVLDDASSTLKLIRKKLTQLEINLKQKLQEIIAKEGSKLSQTSVVIRDDRYCIAVKSEYKNHIKGVIHDTSASMQTCFIEPLVVSQMMSDKSKLIEDEKIEIHRILKELSSILYDEVDLLNESFKVIKEIDYLFSKGMLAVSYDGRKPKLNNEGYMNLIQARHPLLKVKQVIPNNVSFGNGYRGIIVTGPNTGGKTVLLKTVGLLCLMIKYSLLIPASEESNIMIFDQIFCDIGDDQSIESNLSTFSSHMTNITKIINEVTPKSLVLFDEIGSGTDPIEGSNLAKAILKYLIKEKVSFITTTHYSDLKAFGFENSEVINASMEFDQNTLSPTYKLNLGISGSSNAFNIAKRIGLKYEIIKDAKKMTLTSDDDVRKLIFKLEKNAKELDLKTKELEQNKLEFLKLKEEYKQKVDNLEKEKNYIINKAHKEADEFVDKISKEALELLENAKKLQNNDTKLHEIINAKHNVDMLSKKVNKPKPTKTIENKEIKVGDDVYVIPYDQYGVVQKKLKDNSYEISIGNISMKLNREELKLVKSQVVEKPKDSFVSFSKSKVNVSMTLDLRGKRYEEASDLLDKYIDDLLLVGMKQATIIHGYGTGVIRELVQSFVKKNKNIESHRYGGENEGGFGVTVITLK